jgi:hypothetical protein
MLFGVAPTFGQPNSGGFTAPQMCRHQVKVGLLGMKAIQLSFADFFHPHPHFRPSEPNPHNN